MSKISKKYNKKCWKFSRKARINMSNAHLGKPSPNKGRKLSKKWKENISNSCKGRTFSKKTRIKMSNSRIGKKNHRYGKEVSLETRKKLSIANKGKKRTLEVRKKMSLINSGDKHPNWKGGYSKKQYPFNWNELLKESIRIRDKYTCQICDKKQSTYKLCIHHINYKKKDCNPNNLISLCRSCHIKTNYDRKKWIKYFKERLNK